MRVAAVDVGTNSTRLLIADWDGNTLKRIHSDSRITRLGRGVDASGLLEPGAIEETLASMADYRERIVAEGAERMVAVATSAARDATNGPEFLARAEAAGMPVRILDGDEEARLSFAGATIGRGPERQLVVDAGGGSTEVAVGSDGDVGLVKSLDLGCVRLTERFLAHDPPLADELAELAHEVLGIAAPLEDEFAPLPDEAIAVGGTATTLGAISHELVQYDAEVVDLTPLTRDELAALRDRLAAMTVPEIAAMPIVQPGRADVLVAGAALLLAMVDALRASGLLVRDRDILDGIALMATRTQRSSMPSASAG